MNKKNIYIEIKNITCKLIEEGLADEFKMPVNKENSISWEGCTDLSISMKNIAYKDIYNRINREKNFNFKLPDGGIFQLLYEFDDKGLYKHRLAYFPSPDFEEFQNNPDIYLEDNIYGDIVNKQVMPVIVRFDYNREEVVSKIHHPYCHLTLGQYKHCRIPINRPLSPNKFVEFIFENLYYTPTNNFLNSKFEDYVRECEENIHEKDLSKIYLSIN